MGFLNRPLGSYFKDLKTGLVLLGLMGLIRFLAKPVMGLSYDQATNFTSIFWLTVILLTVYAVAAGGRGSNWKDYLANAFVLVFSSEAVIAVAIAADELLGIDTFFTDPAHGGSLSLLVHLGGHLIGATIVLTIVGTLWGWLCGTVAGLLKR